MKTVNLSSHNQDLFQKCLNDNLLDSVSYQNLLVRNIIQEQDLMSADIREPKNRISVIIPTYNRKMQLMECINSILSQDYKNFEIIIVDDCSSDETEEYLSRVLVDSRLKYIKNTTNSGPGYSRRAGFREATGEFVIFCDDDDYYLDPHFFTDAISIFENKEISLICSNTFTHFEKENVFKFGDINFDSMIPVESYLQYFQYKNTKPNSTFSTIFRKRVLDEADLVNMKMVNDSSIYMRSLLCGGKVFVNRKIIGIYRVHSQNITFGIKADFIIENLKEKKNIYKVIVEKNLFEDADEWFAKQIELTVKYLIEANPSNRDLIRVFIWILGNTNKNVVLLMRLCTYKQVVRVRKLRERFNLRNNEN